MTKSRLVLVVALGILVAVALRWRAAPAPHKVAPETTEPPQDEPAEPPSAVPSVERARAAPPSSSVIETQPNEGALMQRLRSVKLSEPALAVELAREGNRRFPETTDAPERASILIHALAQLERSAEARGEAEQMVNHYPDSEWVREIEAFTGAHRHRNLRVNDAGKLESYDP